MSFLDKIADNKGKLVSALGVAAVAGILG